MTNDIEYRTKIWIDIYNELDDLDYFIPDYKKMQNVKIEDLEKLNNILCKILEDTKK